MNTDPILSTPLQVGIQLDCPRYSSEGKVDNYRVPLAPRHNEVTTPPVKDPRSRQILDDRGIRAMDLANRMLQIQTHSKEFEKEFHVENWTSHGGWTAVYECPFKRKCSKKAWRGTFQVQNRETDKLSPVMPNILVHMIKNHGSFHVAGQDPFDPGVLIDAFGVKPKTKYTLEQHVSLDWDHKRVWFDEPSNVKWFEKRGEVPLCSGIWRCQTLWITVDKNLHPRFYTETVLGDTSLHRAKHFILGIPMATSTFIVSTPRHPRQVQWREYHLEWRQFTRIKTVPLDGTAPHPSKPGLKPDSSLGPVRWPDTVPLHTIPSDQLETPGRDKHKEKKQRYREKQKLKKTAALTRTESPSTPLLPVSHFHSAAPTGSSEGGAVTTIGCRDVTHDDDKVRGELDGESDDSSALSALDGNKTDPPHSAQLPELFVIPERPDWRPPSTMVDKTGHQPDDEERLGKFNDALAQTPLPRPRFQEAFHDACLPALYPHIYGTKGNPRSCKP